MKHARKNANYATKLITKQVKPQQEKKPVSNLISIQSVALQQTFVKFS